MSSSIDVVGVVVLFWLVGIVDGFVCLEVWLKPSEVCDK